MKTSSSILNTRFWRLLTAVSQLLELSLLWTLCSLPVVTAGASTAALLAVLSGLRTGGEGGGAGAYFAVMKRCWKRATLCWLAALAVGGLLLVDLTICFRNFSSGYGWAVLTGFITGASLVFCAGLVYLLLLVSGQGGPLRRLAGTAVLLALRNLPSTLVILLAGAFGLWAAGRLWWIAFLFPAFFALPMASAAGRAIDRCARPEGM